MDYLAMIEQASSEPKFKEAMDRLKAAEDRLFRVESTMTDEQRDAIWEFWGLSEEINHMLLQMVCRNTDG